MNTATMITALITAIKARITSPTAKPALSGPLGTTVPFIWSMGVFGSRMTGGGVPVGTSVGDVQAEVAKQVLE